MDNVLGSSAVLKLLQSIKLNKRFLLLSGIDLIVGLIMYTLVQKVDVLSWWEQLSGLISYIDEIISWLLRNPVGLKLNEPVNLALASFFRYHVYLWHTFVQFLNAPWAVNVVKWSLCLGLSTALALFTDLLSLFTLHIHCFDIYASSSYWDINYNLAFTCVFLVTSTFLRFTFVSLNILITLLIVSALSLLEVICFAEGMDETASLLSIEPSEYGAARSVSESVLEKVDPITLSWRDVRVSVKKTKRELLQGVNGIAKPGTLMALMGASGAGKTTLLNTMLTRNLKGLDVDGRIEVNGCEIGEEITAISGYAQQEELFLGTLTVREYLTIQAKLRVRDAAKRKKRVDIVLTQLGLLKCQNTRIGVVGVKKGISGGEGRRLTFACELLSNPAILFCDEPTTGLDSFMAENVVQVLSKLAKNGRTIICTIHQPASQLFMMFDSVMFLAGGRTAFVGSPRNCIQFFETCGFPCPHNFNPADLVIHTLAVVPHEEEKCKERNTKICDIFENDQAGKDLLAELHSLEVGDIPDGRRRVSIFSQISALLHRSVLDNWRNPSLARAKIIQKSVMGLFVGLLYLQTPLNKVGISNINGALFYLVCELTYSTLFGILTFMPADFPLVVREYHDGIYSVFSYYFARSLSYVPLFTVDGIIMVLICYWLVGFSNTVPQVLITLLTCLLIEQSSSAFGVMLSVICPSYPIAVSLAGPLLTLLSLTGGLYANVGALPAYISWVQYLSWFRYGFEALTINQWNQVNGNVTWTNEDRDSILKGFSFEAKNLLMDLLVMFGYIFVFYTIGFIGLTIRISRCFLVFPLLPLESPSWQEVESAKDSSRHGQFGYEGAVPFDHSVLTFALPPSDHICLLYSLQIAVSGSLIREEESFLAQFMALPLLGQSMIHPLTLRSFLRLRLTAVIQGSL